MPDWPNIQGLALVLAFLALVVVGLRAAIEISTAPDMPAERDGLLDTASNPLRDEAEHSRAKYRSHR